jgi:ribonuclease-3
MLGRTATSIATPQIASKPFKCFIHVGSSWRLLYHRSRLSVNVLRFTFYPTSCQMNLSDLEKTLRITFTDKSVLQRALTHRSYLNENPDYPLSDNERLEFLGDAVLDFLTAKYLYNRFPEMAEGYLTSLRAALVKRETLARFATALNLGTYLLLSRGEAESGGREREATLCAAFEALMGAILLDQGPQVAEDFALRCIEPEISRILDEELYKDAKSTLQELTQGQLQITPIYHTVAERGPDHAKEFTVEVLIGEEAYGQGIGPNKQVAEQSAAKAALQKLRQELGQGDARLSVK